MWIILKNTIMRKLLLSISFFSIIGAAQAQVISSENFDVFPATWTKLNLSAPAGANVWAQATTGILTYFGGGAQSGATTSFGFVNFNSTTGGTGTINNWLITPDINLQNGDVISFYAIKGLSGGADVYPDGMQVRLSTAGAASVAPTAGVANVGSYTTLMHDINPGLDETSFPTTWTEYTYTVTGLSGATDCRIAFRYLVTGAGPSGANSDQIGIDTFTVTRPVASTEDFFANNFAVHPNPASAVLNITAKNGVAIESVQIMDINGRVVNQTATAAAEAAQINVADLNAGVYFVKVQTELGTGTSKFIKN